MRIRDRELDWRRLGPLALAVASYVPLLCTRRGMVVADTKQYLFLDPGGVLAASGSLWDPDWAMGTVTHQSIGYLWPMGPWFWFWETVGAPDWVAQRLWIGTILFAAGMGMLALGRVFGWSRSAALVGAFVYLLSPYPLAYTTRISVLVLPWAALPWLVAFGMRALRRGGWREPALIALIGTTVGSVNASSLIYAGLAVVLWFPLAAWLFREVSTRTMLLTAARIGVALIGACLWWAVALVVQGRHGADVLQFSETLSAVASGSPASEAWRGLGYWVLYGSDRAGPWVTAGEILTQNPVVMTATFAMALVSVAALLLTRSRYRPYLLLLAAVGVSLTIGFHPYESPGTVLALVRDDVADTGLALALRSSPRALPLFLLAAAAALAGAVDALPVPRLRARVGVAIVALAALGAPPLWTGDYVGEELARDEAVQPAWLAAAAHLDAGDANHRAIVLPGADFSTHRWGNTIDHILPGLTDRPVAVRELVSYGPAPSGDLLIALDRRAQESLFEPSVVAPIARLMGAGDVIVQNDLEFERYRVPRPDGYWAAISQAGGFDEITEFGPRVANEPAPDLPMLDAIELTMPPDLPDPPAVAALGVADPLGVIRTRPAVGPLVVAGDGESLIDVAEAGLLDPDRLVLYEAALTDEQFLAALASGGELVITDGNRLEARRWKTVRDNRGMTEQIGGDGLRSDPSDARLLLFEDPPIEAFTTARQEGLRVTATSYGNAIAFHSEDRVAHAIDGDVTTAWRVAAFADARGESLRVEFPEPVLADSVVLVQPVTLDRNRHITELDVIVNDGAAARHTLDGRSLAEPGQAIELGVGRVESIELRVWETSSGRRVGYGGDSAVGFAEVIIGDTTVEEVIVLPTTPARRAATFDGEPPTTVLFSRERATERRDDPEVRLHREFALATPASFELGGIGRLASFAADEVAAAAVGIVAPPFATASDRLTRDTFQAPWVAVDGDPTTVWSTPFGPPERQWLELDLGLPVEVGRFSLTVVADGRHSVPTVLEIGTDAGVERVSLPSIIDRSSENAVTVIPVVIQPVVTSRLRLTVVEARPVTTIDWFSLTSIETPVAIAEVDVPGVSANPPDLEVLGECRSDLLWIDDEPVTVRLVLESRSATGGYAVEACEGTVFLGAGTHRLRTTAGRVSGIDLDLLTLRSDGDRAVPPVPPSVTIEAHGRGSASVSFSAADEPFWLVLGESYESGWEATLGGVDLGPPTLVDGFANGWLVDPAETGSAGTVELEWGPNRAVRVGFVASVAVFVVLGFLVWRRPGSAAPDPSARTRLGPVPWQVGSTGLRLALASGVAVIVAAGTRPWIGLLVGAAVFLASARRFGHWVLPLVGLGALGAAAAYVVLLQIRYQGPLDGAWPSLWGRPHLLGWITLGAVIGELVLELTCSVGGAPDERTGDVAPTTGSGP